MTNESEPEKRLEIRPRGLDEKEVPGEPSEAQEGKPDAKKLKWNNRLRQSGAKFPAKMVSKALKSSRNSGDGEPSPSEGKTEPAAEPGRDPKGVEPVAPPAKALEPDSLDLREMGRGIRRRAVKRIRLIYALAAGLVAVVLCSIVFWKREICILFFYNLQNIPTILETKQHCCEFS